MGLTSTLADVAAGLPPRVRRLLDQLAGPRLHFLPIRHHSPVCARALRAMLAELQPGQLLLEAPESLQDLLPLLQHPATRPPVAVLLQPAADESGPGWFYPLCDYSPEWLAIRAGATPGLRLRCIDLAPQSRGAAEGPGSAAQSLLDEHWLRHSARLQALCARLGCRDHDELWERCFEARLGQPGALDWRQLARELAAWCALARLDCPDAALAADGTLAREQRMLAHVRSALADPDPRPILVLSGGFHTLGLVEGLAAPAPRSARKRAVAAAPRQWLLRYSFDRLDALNGYAAGMPAPHYWQQLWLQLEAGTAQPWHTVLLDLLQQFAARQRGSDRHAGVSTADVQAAALQALRLAELRGLPGPGRMELLDACQSCFVKGPLDDGQRGFQADLRQLLAGTALGDVPSSAGSPPLLEEARRRARALGFRLDDSSARQVELDLYRKPRQVARSRFLHLLDWLGCGCGQWLGGPDFLSGAGLHLLLERWRVAWSPAVEAALLRLSMSGSSLQQVALQRLHGAEAALCQDGRGRSAAGALQLLLRACLVGLEQALPALLQKVSWHVAEDPSFVSVVQALEKLDLLGQGHLPLLLPEPAALAALRSQLVEAALLLLQRLDRTPAAEEKAVAMALAGLRECLCADVELCARLQAGLQRLLDPAAAPGVAGAAMALRFLDAEVDEAGLAGFIGSRFGSGATPEAAVRCLDGLLRVAPELLEQQPLLLAALDGTLARWDEADFVQWLPDLRLAFAALRPQATARLAGLLALRHGLRETLQQQHEGSADEALEGVRLELELRRLLAAHGLAGSGAAP